MSRIMSPSLLLVLALTIPGGTNLTGAEDCNGTEIVMKERRVIETMEYGNSSFLYVKPESDFLGVCLTSQRNNGTNHTACFYAKECFPHNGKLQQFWPWMHENSLGTTLTFGIWSSTCRLECKMDIPSQTLHKFSVVAYGPSKWMKSQPKYCNFAPKNISILRTTPCDQPSLITIPTQGKNGNMNTVFEVFLSHQLTIIIASLMVGMVVVVLVGVAWWKLYLTSPKYQKLWMCGEGAPVTNLLREAKCYTETECKDKWRHLRSNFMRERRKISAKTSGSGNTETRKWVYYDAMQFLIPHVTPRPTSSNVPTPPDEDTCHEAEDAPQDSSPSVVIETPDNVSPQEAASNTETCEDRSTAKPILPMSKKTSVTKKRSRDTADEIDPPLQAITATSIPTTTIFTITTTTTTPEIIIVITWPHPLAGHPSQSSLPSPLPP
ncbi:hypothetical protein O3P69_000910 [Scylla paramamosain]|uniref:MADF domain-containing protein n=1 Tax=Scylla paramamosain TaxID=85552 RepID=A0AAW0UUX8_SCYPA